VLALLVFYSLVHRIQCSVKVTVSELHRLCLAPPSPFQLPFSFYCDVAETQSYFASTVQSSHDMASSHRTNESLFRGKNMSV
jgi:hypothetical protein